MNEHKLQQKRRKRQANRKAAQVTAKRRGHFEKQQREHALYEMRHPRKPSPMPGLLSRLAHRVGSAITPDQMDAEAAPIEGASV
jgi:hypothetical protein